MPISASNYVIAPKQEEVVVSKVEASTTIENKGFVITGGDWRSQINKMIEDSSKLNNSVLADSTTIKPRNKKSTVLVEYKHSSFINDMLSKDEQ